MDFILFKGEICDLFMYYINMVVRERKKGALFGSQCGGIVEIVGCESRLTQSLYEVVAVDAAMVILPEDAGALLGVGD